MDYSAGKGSWEAVETAFVNGWEYQYKLEHCIALKNDQGTSSAEEVPFFNHEKNFFLLFNGKVLNGPLFPTPYRSSIHPQRIFRDYKVAQPKGH